MTTLPPSLATNSVGREIEKPREAGLGHILWRIADFGEGSQ
jgi:hypothetical protein